MKALVPLLRTDSQAFFPIVCQPPSEPENGGYNCHPSPCHRLTQGTVIEYICDEGYILKGGYQFRTCDNGEWKSSLQISCHPVQGMSHSSTNSAIWKFCHHGTYGKFSSLANEQRIILNVLNYNNVDSSSSCSSEFSTALEVLGPRKHHLNMFWIFSLWMQVKILESSKICRLSGVA